MGSDRSKKISGTMDEISCPKCQATFGNQRLMEAHYRHTHSNYDQDMTRLVRQYHGYGMSWIQASEMAREKLLFGAEIPDVNYKKKKRVSRYESEQAIKDREEKDVNGGQNPMNCFRAR